MMAKQIMSGKISAGDHALLEYLYLQSSQHSRRVPLNGGSSAASALCFWCCIRCSGEALKINVRALDALMAGEGGYKAGGGSTGNTEGPGAVTGKVASIRWHAETHRAHASTNQKAAGATPFTGAHWGCSSFSWGQVDDDCDQIAWQALLSSECSHNLLCKTLCQKF